MKRSLTRVGLFYCTLSLFFTTQVEAQQCIQLFYEKASTQTNRLMFTNINASISEADTQLKSHYAELNSTASNLDRNQVLQKIVETNNHILEMFDFIVTHPHLNSSKRAKEVQSGLLNNLFLLFKKQGLSPQLINGIIRSRITLINQINADAGKISGPIGFLHPTTTDSKEPLQRTIGFHRQKIEADPYGRRNRDQAARASHKGSKNPIGFVHPKADESPAKPMKSIGFVQSEDSVDVAYQISLGFNFGISAFISVSSQHAVGF